MHTKFGHDLFRTFEYWIDEKAQKREKQKETVEKIGKGVISSLKECIQMMAGLSKGFGQLDYQDLEKKKIKRGLDGLGKNGSLG